MGTVQNNEIEAVTKNSSKKKSSRPDGFKVKFY